MAFVSIAACILLFVSISSWAQTGPNRTEINKVVASYDKAWNAKDVKTVDARLADNYIYFTSTGGTTDRKKTLEFLVSPDYKLTFVERSEIEVHHVDRTTAMVSSRWKGKGSFGKEVIDDDQRCSMVFIRVQKNWKLLSEHCTQIVTK